MSERKQRQTKAYNNETFLNGKDGRTLRILAEYLEPKSRFERAKVDDTIVFMGSARTLAREQAEQKLSAAEKTGGDVEAARVALEMSAYYEASRELAFRLTQWAKQIDQNEKRFVVCTGGGPGIMEAANRGAAEMGEPTVGLNIALPHEQSANPYVTPSLSFKFHYFALRKMHFMMRAKALVAFPGGFGTLDELFEVITLVQTRKAKPVPIVLFGTDYWKRLLNFDVLVEEGAISPEDLKLFTYVDEPQDAWDAIRSFYGL